MLRVDCFQVPGSLPKSLLQATKHTHTYPFPGYLSPSNRTNDPRHPVKENLKDCRTLLSQTFFSLFARHEPQRGGCMKCCLGQQSTVDSTKGSWSLLRDVEAQVREAPASSFSLSNHPRPLVRLRCGPVGVILWELSRLAPPLSRGGTGPLRGQQRREKWLRLPTAALKCPRPRGEVGSRAASGPRRLRAVSVGRKCGSLRGSVDLSFVKFVCAISTRKGHTHQFMSWPS